MPDYIIIIQILIKESMPYIFTRFPYIFTRFPKPFSLPSQLFNGFCSKNKNDVNQKAQTDHVPGQQKVVGLYDKVTGHAACT